MRRTNAARACGRGTKVPISLNVLRVRVGKQERKGLFPVGKYSARVSSQIERRARCPPRAGGRRPHVDLLRHARLPRARDPRAQGPQPRRRLVDARRADVRDGVREQHLRWRQAAVVRPRRIRLEEEKLLFTLTLELVQRNVLEKQYALYRLRIRFLIDFLVDLITFLFLRLMLLQMNAVVCVFFLLYTFFSNLLSLKTARWYNRWSAVCENENRPVGSLE